MFQFTSTNVINSDLDISGLPKWTAEDGKFNVKKVNNFLAENITHVYVREPKQPVLSTARLKVTDLSEGSYMLSIRTGMTGNMSAFYANRSEQMPANYQFNVIAADTAEQIVDKVVAIVEKINSFYGDERINIEKEGTDVILLTAADEYIIFTYVAIEKYEVLANGYETYTPVIQSEVGSATSPIVIGTHGFGTYNYLIRNFRLPYNTTFGLAADEVPVAGGEYTQYTLHYKANRGILGTDAVGDDVDSITTHVFYVIKAHSADFEAKLTTALGADAATKIVTVA